MFPSKTSIALGFVASLLIYPYFSSLFKCECTVDVDFKPTASHVSLTEGGYPLDKSELLLSDLFTFKEKISILYNLGFF